MACSVEATRLRGSSLPFLEMSPARDEKAAATSAQVADAVYDELLSQVPGRPPKARHVLCPTLLLVVRPPLLLLPHAAVDLRPQGKVADVQRGAPLGEVEALHADVCLGAEPLGRLEASGVVVLQNGPTASAWVLSLQRTEDWARYISSATAPFQFLPSMYSHTITLPLPTPARTMVLRTPVLNFNFFEGFVYGVSRPCPGLRYAPRQLVCRAWDRERPLT